VYQLLKGRDEHSLRVERLGNLETDHYRIGLQLEEVANDDAGRATLLQQQHELERRMNIHLRALSPEPAEADEVDTPGELADDKG